jgi:hypothetical protein
VAQPRPAPGRVRRREQAQLLRAGLDNRLHVLDRPADQRRQLERLKAGRGVIPVKLIPSCGNSNLAPKITIDYTGAGFGDVDETVAWVSSADTGSTMRWDASAGQYIYNLDRKNKTAGNYELSITVAGIQVLTAEFDLK